jgi:hypothetical protein
LAPSESIIEEKYGNCMMWGLSWFGTTKNAEIARQLLLLINRGVGFTVSLAKYKFLGGSIARLFNSISARELMEVGLDHIADIIIKDFVKLSSILWDKREIFVDGTIDLLLVPETPTRGDVERAVLRIWSENRQKEIDKTLVKKTIESDLSRKGIALKSDWWTSIEEKLEDWFR